MRGFARMTRWVITLVTIVASQLSAQSGRAPSAPRAADAGIDRERLSIIRTRMNAFVEQGQIAGVVTLIARRTGPLTMDAVGYRDLEARDPMRADTVFRVSSVAKPVTALGIMILLEEGRLTLNDPVERYLPEFKDVRMKDGTPPKTRVTLHGLLTHTSGLATEGTIFKPEFVKKNLPEVVAAYAVEPLDSQPGTKFLYSSPGFDTLGRIIEVVSGKPYEVFVRERLLQPLGMVDTHFILPPEKRTRLASSYRLENGRLQKALGSSAGTSEEARTFVAPAWGMYSTAADLGALLQMMLNDGTHRDQRIISRASARAMTMMQTPEPARTGQGANQGLGWFVAQHAGVAGPLTSAGTYGHVGSTGVIAWVDPGQELVGVLLKHQPDAWNVTNTFMAMAAAAIVE